jgi:hypothetical protein
MVRYTLSPHDTVYLFSEEITGKRQDARVFGLSRGEAGTRSKDLERSVNSETVLELSKKVGELCCLGSRVCVNLIEYYVLQ